VSTGLKARTIREILRETQKRRPRTGPRRAAKGESGARAFTRPGPQPNVVPPGEAEISGELRPVEIGWHPVGGLGGKWFAEKTGLGKMITEKIHKYPDPTQHWAVLVGEYVHELWMV